MESYKYLSILWDPFIHKRKCQNIAFENENAKNIFFKLYYRFNIVRREMKRLVNSLLFSLTHKGIACLPQTLTF